jgi:hypothetical protein
LFLRECRLREREKDFQHLQRRQVEERREAEALERAQGLREKEWNQKLAMVERDENEMLHKMDRDLKAQFLKTQREVDQFRKVQRNHYGHEGVSHSKRVLWLRLKAIARLCS